MNINNIYNFDNILLLAFYELDIIKYYFKKEKNYNSEYINEIDSIKEQISNMFNDMIHDNRYFDFEYDEEEDIVADSIEIEINDKWFESAVETYLDSLVSDGYATNDGEYYHLVSEED